MAPKLVNIFFAPEWYF